uniref:Uncharacterized protein n=1 Tax=Amphimedon queenslandica TaxID=400682 RepID=A0A1X7US49_AMPQE
MLNGTWPQIRQIKIHQSPKFSNSVNFSPSKISFYTVSPFLFHILALSILSFFLSLSLTSKTQVPVSG